MKGFTVAKTLLTHGCDGSLWLKSAINSLAGIRSSSSLVAQTSKVDFSYNVYPVDSRELDVSKAPLVFLHGLFGAKGNLHSISKHLSSTGRKVVTYDARNHGNSGHTDDMDIPLMAEDLGDLVGQLSLKQPAIMGHSMGGKTAMAYALLNPGNLSSLIVADVTPQASPGVDVLINYAVAMKRVSIPQNMGIPKARRKVEVQLTSSVPERSVLQFLLTNLVESDNGVVKWRINLDAFLNNPKAIGDFPSLKSKPFTKPTLFVFGEDSSHYKHADVGLIKALFPAAQIEAIPNAGHFVHAEKPIEFFKIVQGFLEQLERN